VKRDADLLTEFGWAMMMYEDAIRGHERAVAKLEEKRHALQLVIDKAALRPEGNDS
jgi:hypothetical protein